MNVYETSLDECLLARAASLVCEMLSAKRLRGVSEIADFDVRMRWLRCIRWKVNVVEWGVTTVF